MFNAIRLSVDSTVFIEKALAVVLSESAAVGAVCVDLNPENTPVMTWWTESDNSIPTPVDFPAVLVENLKCGIDSVFSTHELITLSEEQIGLNLLPQDHESLLLIVTSMGKDCYWTGATNGIAIQFQRR